MATWPGFLLVILALAALFGFILFLVWRSQNRDFIERGGDSSEPGGFYTPTSGA